MRVEEPLCSLYIWSLRRVILLHRSDLDAVVIRTHLGGLVVSQCLEAVMDFYPREVELMRILCILPRSAARSPEVVAPRCRS